MSKIFSKFPQTITYLSWGIALGAMLISLIFSELLNFPPCTLCWWQRIFMYPLVFIIPIGVLNKDSKIYSDVLILSGIGLFIALYHSLIYHEIIKDSLTICTATLSCKTKQFELFNLISIPVMSTLSFLLIFVLNLLGVFSDKRS